MNKSEKEKINMLSSDKIQFFRKQKGIIIEKLAEKLNVESRTYFNKAKGKTEFTATEAWMLINILDVSLDDLIKNESEMNESEKSKFEEVYSRESVGVEGDDGAHNIVDPLEYSLEEIQNIKKNSKEFKFNIMSGKKIKHYMHINGITTDEIAGYIGKRGRAFFNKVKGETEFTATEAWILTKLFGCTFNDLIKDFK